MTNQYSHIHEFGPWRLDAAQHLLFHQGAHVPLQPKAFEILLALVERPGEVVSKEELMESVWPDTFVEEINLTKNISVLRKALANGDGTQDYIQTIPKRGYRFVAAVSVAQPEPSATQQFIFTPPAIPGEASVAPAEPPATAPFSASSLPPQPMPELLAAGKTTSLLKRHKLSVSIALVMLLAAAAMAVYFSVRETAIDSLAVLPFVNVGANPDAEYLSDGITDSLINSLAQAQRLKVMSRSAVLRYKGKEADAQAAGKALGVRAVLTGKVTLRGDDLIVKVELVDVRNNSHLWGEQYNHKLSDLLAVQTELARDIAAQLRLRLSGEEQQRLTRRGTENPEAYDLYLKGRYILNRFTHAEKNGLRYFQQAVEKDANFALAYAGLAEAYVMMADIGATFALPPQEAYIRAKAAALKAVGLDDTLAEAHSSLGHIAYKYEWDWAGAEREFKRAIALKPNLYLALHSYSHLLIVQGRFDESLAVSQRVLALDPLDIPMNYHLGVHYENARQLEPALVYIEKALAMNPNQPYANSLLGLVFAQQGRYREAIEKMQISVKLSDSDQRGNLGYVYAVAGQRAEARKVLTQLQEEARTKSVSQYFFALIYAGLGEQEAAFAALGKAVDERDGNLTHPGLKVDTRIDSLRSDPRFAGLLRRMGLEP